MKVVAHESSGKDTCSWDQQFAGWYLKHGSRESPYQTKQKIRTVLHQCPIKEHSTS